MYIYIYIYIYKSHLGRIDGKVTGHESGSVVCIPRIEPAPRHPNVNI